VRLRTELVIEPVALYGLTQVETKVSVQDAKTVVKEPVSAPTLKLFS
jgi:hypothetical protein